MRLPIKIALAWLVFAGLTRLDDAINDGLPSAPVPRSKDNHHAHPIIAMTALLGGLGFVLAREIRGEERSARAGESRKLPRSPWRRAALRLRRTVWSGGFVIVMAFAWAMQVHIFVTAMSLPGWKGRPALVALLGAVLITYAALTCFWGERYLRILGRRHAPGKSGPPRAAGVWDSELDNDFAHELRPVS